MRGGEDDFPLNTEYRGTENLDIKVGCGLRRKGEKVREGGRGKNGVHG